MDENRSNAQEEGLFQRTTLRASSQQRNAIYESILDSSHMDTEYVALLALAGLIALFGLLENSAAVIIGAMLISPLMNPILSAALALLLGDGGLGKRSASVLALSIAGVVVVTWLVASLTPLKQVTPEILARTSPNLLDLFIAFLSGLAGTLALRGGSVAMTILPGVAIAVAVVPPLAVVGYGLSAHRGSIAAGAFLLFVTNLVAIIISAAAVFRVIGFQPQREAEQGRWKLKYRLGISAVVLLLLSIPLFLTLRRVAIAVAERSEVQRDLRLAFETENASISDLNLTSLRKGLLIQATLHTTRYVESDTIRSIEAALRNQFGSETKLQIDQILVTQGGAPAAQPVRPQNPITGGVVKPVEEKAPFDFKQAGDQSLAFVESGVDAILAGTAIKREAPPDIVLSATAPLVVSLKLASPEPLDSQTVSVFGSQLGTKLGLQAQLHGQVDLQGASYRLTLAPANPRLGLDAANRTAVMELIGQAQQDNLRLRVSYAPGGSPGDGQTPRLVSEIRDFLTRSRLKSTQWTIETELSSETPPKLEGGTAEAPTGAAGKKPKGTAPGGLRCELRLYQDF